MNPSVIATVAKRIRRAPEEARKVILDAAERVIARTGPGGLRLQEVAEAAGVSHPTILHHFESRDGLIRALNRRTLDELAAMVKAQMESPNSNSGDGVRAAFAAYRGGFAERVLWMIQSEAEGGPSRLEVLDAMVDRLHALRLRFAAPGREPPRSDSEAIIHLIAIAAFGDAIIGRRLRRAPDAAAEVAARDRFETWIGDLIGEHVDPRQRT